MRQSALIGILVPLSMLAGVGLWIIVQSTGVVSPILPYDVQSPDEVTVSKPRK